VSPDKNAVDEHPLLEPSFRQELVVRLIGELRNGPRSFASLVGAAEGAYPADVQSVLEGLRAEQIVSISESGLWTRAASVLGPVEQQVEYLSELQCKDGLPEPHPLDFDWRFTTHTLTKLAKSLKLSKQTRVAVLGAPTLYRHLVDIGADATLFDRNPRLVQHLRSEGYSSVTECDLLEFPKLEPGYQCALADPPWYVEHYEAFIDAARRLLVPSGRLLLSILPRLTRPSASQDRISILECAAYLGFDLIEAELGALRYLSPPFEIEALRTDGIILDDWRSGDLFSFVLGSRPPEQVKHRHPTNKETWHTHQLGGTTIKVKVQGGESNQAFRFQPASSSKNIRLRSVSRRSPARSRINLWTSRNIALKVSKTAVLEDALQKIGNGESPMDSLASVAYEYQLTDDERGELQELLRLLSQDAGLKWID